MSTRIIDEAGQQDLLFRHKPPWCWLRLRELHLVASGKRPAHLQVLDPSIKDKFAQRAYENALGASMATQAFLDGRNLDAMMNSMADFLEAHGIDGLEPLLLSGMFGLEGINLRRPGRTTTLERLAQVLLNSPLPQPIAGGIGKIPIVDRAGGRIHFYRSDGISQMLSNVAPWLGGVNAGMGGVGGFGYDSGGPIFNSFRDGLSQRSAETSASGSFCAGFGAGVGKAIESVFFSVGGAFGSSWGASFGALTGPLGGLPGAYVGFALGGLLGDELGRDVVDKSEVVDLATQACNGIFAEDPEEDPEVTDPGTEEMPNPTSEETGLTPTDIQIAIAVARINAAKRVDPNQTIIVGSDPVIVSSLEAKRALVVLPAYDPGVTTDRVPIVLGPRPGGPLTGRLANVLNGHGASSVHVGQASAGMTFSRVRPGEYVPEINRR